MDTRDPMRRKQPDVVAVPLEIDESELTRNLISAMLDGPALTLVDLADQRPSDRKMLRIPGIYVLIIDTGGRRDFDHLENWYGQEIVWYVGMGRDIGERLEAQYVKALHALAAHELDGANAHFRFAGASARWQAVALEAFAIERLTPVLNHVGAGFGKGWPAPAPEEVISLFGWSSNAPAFNELMKRVRKHQTPRTNWRDAFPELLTDARLAASERRHYPVV